MDYVKKRLMPSLAGALGVDAESSEPVLDLVEITSILLIPHLSKVAREADREERESFFGRLVELILLDVTGSTTSERKLDRSFVKGILEFYGETDVPTQAIDDMLAAAGVLGGGDADEESTPGILFSADLLIKATTSDITVYNNEWENSHTTHFDDVFSGTALQHDNFSSRREEDKIIICETEKGSTDQSVRPKLHHRESVARAVQKRKIVVSIGSIGVENSIGRCFRQLTPVIFFSQLSSNSPPCHGSTTWLRTFVLLPSPSFCG